MAEFNKQTSPYKTTPIKDFYMDLLEYRDIIATDDDKTYVIEAKYHLRPDLLAYDLYGTPNLFWVFYIRNKDVLLDPINDFTSGTTIMVSPQSHITDVLF